MHQLISEAFNRTFSPGYNTYLQGGHDEPFYKAPTESEAGVICYREDYASSALHEVAHWCVAGPERRKLDDYGYWYIPDGRSQVQQVAFESAEVRPQALEWIFSVAVGISFQISADNLLANRLPGEGFANAVYAQVQQYLESGLETRAQSFLDALRSSTGLPQPVPERFQLTDLCFEHSH